MVETMKDWNGEEIRIVRSKRGKICVCDYEDNLIIPIHSVWPHPDIVKKLYRSEHSKDFDPPALSKLSKKLGFYCDLQSLRSEDAITWSVFGTLHYFPKETKVQFVNSLLKAIDEKSQVNDCLIQLWTRIAHPDTLVSGGPELDFHIVCDRVVIFGEAKWASKIAKNQGKGKSKDQLQLRKEFQEKYGNKIFHKADKLVVLAMGISKQQNHAYAYITWEDLCNKTKHPLGKELKSYYLWKKEYGARAPRKKRVLV
jgi:hypothetical protein